MSYQQLAKRSYVVVDDDENTRIIFTMLLENMIGSANVTILSTNDRFEQDLANLTHTPDFFFLDLMMEPYSGYEMLEMIQQQEKYENAHIIAITARVMPHDLEKMRNAGFHGLISKPIASHIFPELLQRILDGESIWYIA